MRKGKTVLMIRKLAVSIGQTLQDPKYNVAAGYTHGFSHAALANNLKKLPEFSSHTMYALRNGVRCSLVGNDDEKLGEVYSGSLTEEVYRKHAIKHNHDTSRANCLLQVKERKGVHGLDTTKLKEFAMESVSARGLMEWTREELSTVLAFSLQEIYKKDGFIDYRGIARQLNEHLYDGRDVRTGYAVKGALQRMKQLLTTRSAA